MSCKVIDINTVIIDDTTYIAVESTNCSNCDLRNTHGCSEVGTRIGCSSYRADERHVSWKKSNIKPPTTNKFTLINKKKTYKLNFKP